MADSKRMVIRLNSYITTACHVQYSTYALNTELTLVLPNKFVSHSLFREKMLIVFLEAVMDFEDGKLDECRGNHIQVM